MGGGGLMGEGIDGGEGLNAYSVLGRRNRMKLTDFPPSFPVSLLLRSLFACRRRYAFPFALASKTNSSHLTTIVCPRLLSIIPEQTISLINSYVIMLSFVGVINIAIKICIRR